MRRTNAERIALKFVECINKQDIEGLVTLMTEEFTMIAYERKPETGRELMREGFQGYFTDFPKYKIHVLKVARSGDDIAIIGKTTGSHIAPEIEAKETVIWIAKVEDNLVSEWRIFSDLDHLGE
jgi:ketosteroid isomerase-like protein